MSINNLRHCVLLLLATTIGLLLLRDSSQAQANASLGTIPPLAPVLTNPDMECDDGYYEVTGPDRKPNRIPDGWQQVLNLGHPRMNSARLQFAKSCEAEGVHIEKINGRDSFTVLAWEIETPPEPGKPFDVTIYQQTPVEAGGDYSVSGWFLTLCGGSAVPNDCPDGIYMAKMLGLDPTGGIDPYANTVVWTENRNNFVDENDERIGWSNLYTAATAEAGTMTVFARIDSPFQWHGNHGFIDAISLIRSPVAEFVDLPAEVSGDRLDLAWDGQQSPDVEAIAGGNYDLLFDIDVRHEDETTWRSLVSDTGSPGSIPFRAGCLDSSYQFRIRARAEQPDDEEGAWPNQRYPGPWSNPQTVLFKSEGAPAEIKIGDYSIYLPLISRGGQC